MVIFISPLNLYSFLEINDNKSYQSILDETLGRANPRLITDDYGVFTYSTGKKSSEKLYLPNLFSLLNFYTKFFSLRQLYISILIADSDYLPLCFIKGIYGYFKHINMNDLLMKETNIQNHYFEELVDGSLLDGVICINELGYDHNY
ncbi:MAG: hypothetical protein ACFE9L_11060 [Candidatus Hodarchaeota archaeon]